MNAIDDDSSTKFAWKVPTQSGPQKMTLRSGETMIFIGANGSGKTRLAAYVEDALGIKAHRIAAHRALDLNEVQIVGEDIARVALITGVSTKSSPIQARVANRWRGQANVALLQDFDQLLQVMFAQQVNITAQSHQQLKYKIYTSPQQTYFDKLKAIWENLILHRSIHISGDSITAYIRPPTGTPSASVHYSASAMSDGERSIFYLIGQVLVASEKSLLIIDEPELHLHRSLSVKLWEELTSARPDCGFLFITHDLDFAASMRGKKYLIRSFAPGADWDLSEIPDDSDFPEDILTLILGSRRPILFVEGEKGGLDSSLYSVLYPEWTTIPCGSCDEVERSVKAMKRHDFLTRIHCAGIIDADGKPPDVKLELQRHGIHVLPVAELENVLLLPDVMTEIAKSDKYIGEELESKITVATKTIFEFCSNDVNQQNTIARHCRRRIDALVRSLRTDKTMSIAELDRSFSDAIKSFDVIMVATEASNNIADAIRHLDLHSLLAVFDHKGLLSKIASSLRHTSRDEFESWIVRIIRSGGEPALIHAIRMHIPNISFPPAPSEAQPRFEGATGLLPIGGELSLGASQTASRPDEA